jgi:hypothetical protein
VTRLVLLAADLAFVEETVANQITVAGVDVVLAEFSHAFHVWGNSNGRR